MRLAGILLIASGLGFLAVQVDVPPSGVAVPMLGPRNPPVIEAMINGKGPFRFILDSGATDPVMQPDLAAELALPVTGSRRVGDPAEPEGITARTLRLDKLTVGGAVFRDLTAVTWDGAADLGQPGIRGVIGLSCFSRLLLTVDYPKGEVRIDRGYLSASEKDVVEYKTGPEGIVRVPVTVGSSLIYADLDTGSPAGVSLPMTLADQLPLEGKPVVVGRARTAGGEFAIYAARSKAEIRVGSHLLDPSLEFHDRLPIGNVGYRVLRDFAITIDQQNRRIRFVKGSG